MKALSNTLSSLIVIFLFLLTIRAGKQLIDSPDYGTLIVFILFLLMSFASIVFLFDKNDDGRKGHTT